MLFYIQWSRKASKEVPFVEEVEKLALWICRGRVF